MDKFLLNRKWLINDRSIFDFWNNNQKKNKRDLNPNSAEMFNEVLENLYSEMYQNITVWLRKF